MVKLSTLMRRSAGIAGALVLTAAVTVDAASAHPVPPPSVIDLGTLGGAPSRATAVNRAGVVVGTAQTADGSEHAFVWDPASRRMRDLGTAGVVAGQDYSLRSEATGINDRGQVVGNSCGDATPWRCIAFVWEPRGGRLRLLPSSGEALLARAINNHGVIVGGRDGYPASWCTKTDGWRLIDDPSTTRDGYAMATDINDRGQVAGLGSPTIPGPDSGETEPFVFSTARQRTSFMKPQNCCYGNGPVAINDHGQVAANGFGFTSPALVWNLRSGRVVRMPGDGQAADINNAGLVVGTRLDEAGVSRAFWWNPASRVVRELTGLGGPTQASALNDRGWVVGASARPGSAQHAVLWRPKVGRATH